ncbi:methyl-accepting chemotaxis protein [Algibacillus agarilyticus]|uniref:methyl-accepting chemotaxis protein n=1 Tax=Algibacillus agarilyticus TaxID=2234133 RepID=UPI000DCF7B4C|nr:HAMP domain-containing methyl-accepting chemotaxis protein [Algibacillus agarilyticus]
MAFFSLGMKLANRYSFSAKFSLIAILFAVTLIYAGSHIYQSTSHRIQDLKIEQHGIEAINALKALLYNERELNRSTWQSFTAFLTTHDLVISSTATSNVQAFVNKATPESVFEALFRVNREVLAISGLKSDADKESNFLIEIAFIEHPKLQHLVNVLNKQAKETVAQGRFTPQSYLLLTDIQNQVMRLIDEVEQNIDIVKSANNQIASRLRLPTETIKKYTEFVKSDILDPDTINVSSQNLQNRIDDADKALQTILALAQERIINKIEVRLTAQQNTQYFAVILFIFLGVFAFYSLASIAYSIRKNVDQVSAYSLLVAEGNLSVTLDIQSKDSLGEIGTHLNEIAEQLNQKILRINSANQHIQSASDAVEKSVQASLTDVENQQEQTALVASATQQMASTVAEVANNAETASHATSQAGDAAHKGRDFVFETINKIDSLAKDVSNASDTINHLQSEVLKISSVLEVITSIADQTNLLALNAAIEAARAGEHGRGFSVVAEEVRSLAQKTQSSTEEINTMIKALQQGATDSVNVMDQSQKGAQEAVDMIVQAGEMLDHIQKSIEQINEQNAQVATATEEQSMVAKDINQSSLNLKTATDQITHCIQMIVEVNKGLVNDAGELDALVGEFKLKS